MADEYIKRKDVLECIKESRDGIDWGQSEDGDAFLHYSACLYRTIASNECFPSTDVVEVIRCKDCKFHTTDPECFDEFEITDKSMMCIGIRYGGVDPDWFCEHGERMDGA